MFQPSILPSSTAELTGRSGIFRGLLRRPTPSVHVPDVRVLLDLPYGDDVRNRLDLYLPSTRSFPIAVFVHGGSWCSGDKALYGHLGNFLARYGIGTVVANYRLSPRARHPEHAQDVATAVAWAFNQTKSSGGDPDRLFLIGHSAGAHLVSLLATDATYLRPWGLSPDHIRGVIGVSGVYQIHWNVHVCGLNHVFRGADKRSASPLSHVKPGCPPFLILHAQRETWTLTGQARRFHTHLLACHNLARLMMVPEQNHVSIIHSAVVPGAAHGQEIVAFIRGDQR